MKRFLEVYNNWFYTCIYAPISQLHLFCYLCIKYIIHFVIHLGILNTLLLDFFWIPYSHVSRNYFELVVAEISPHSKSPKLCIFLRDSGDTAVTYTVVKTHYLWPPLHIYTTLKRVFVIGLNSNGAWAHTCATGINKVSTSRSDCYAIWLLCWTCISGIRLHRLILICGVDSCLPSEAGERTV